MPIVKGGPERQDMTAAAAPASPIDGDSQPIGGPLARGMVGLGDWSLFALRALRGVAGRAFSRRELLRVAVEVGVGSVTVVVITGMFIGMVLAVQTYSQFRQVGLET